MKVLMIISTFGIASGVNTFAMNYFRNINHKDVQIDFICFYDRPSSYINEINSHGGKTFILPPVKNIFQHIKQCNKILKEGDYDIVHNNTLILSIPLMLVSKLTKVPIRILHSHATKLGETKTKIIRNKILLPLLKWSSTDYIACSVEAGKGMFGKNGNFTIIPNVIQTEKYIYDEQNRRNIRKKFGFSEKVVIGTVGRLSYQKNPFFALDVFKYFLKTNPNSIFIWVGNGPLEKDVMEYSKKIGVGDKFLLLGKREDVIDLYQAMDCFFLPSLFEGLPLTGIESQAMGLPIVVSDTVTKEMVFTDLVDYVSLTDSIDSWVLHIEKSVNMQNKREEYTQLLKESRFSNINCGSKLTHTYKEMLSNK